MLVLQCCLPSFKSPFGPVGRCNMWIWCHVSRNSRPESCVMTCWSSCACHVWYNRMACNHAMKMWHHDLHKRFLVQSSSPLLFRGNILRRKRFPKEPDSIETGLCKASLGSTCRRSLPLPWADIWLSELHLWRRAFPSAWPLQQFGPVVTFFYHRLSYSMGPSQNYPNETCQHMPAPPKQKFCSPLDPGSGRTDENCVVEHGSSFIVPARIPMYPVHMSKYIWKLGLEMLLTSLDIHCQSGMQAPKGYSNQKFPAPPGRAD